MEIVVLEVAVLLLILSADGVWRPTQGILERACDVPTWALIQQDKTKPSDRLLTKKSVLRGRDYESSTPATSTAVETCDP